MPSEFNRIRLSVGLATLAIWVTNTACGNTTGLGGGGNLVVAVETTGSNIDPDGYELVITGRNTSIQFNQSLAVNDSLRLSLPSSGYTLDLTDIAANCSTTNNPRTVSVVGSTVATEYDVTCN